jgi:hypothetical protein
MASPLISDSLRILARCEFWLVAILARGDFCQFLSLVPVGVATEKTLSQDTRYRCAAANWAHGIRPTSGHDISD